MKNKICVVASAIGTAGAVLTRGVSRVNNSAHSVSGNDAPPLPPKNMGTIRKLIQDAGNIYDSEELNPDAMTDKCDKLEEGINLLIKKFLIRIEKYNSAKDDTESLTDFISKQETFILDKNWELVFLTMLHFYMMDLRIKIHCIRVEFYFTFIHENIGILKKYKHIRNLREGLLQQERFHKLARQFQVIFHHCDLVESLIDQRDVSPYSILLSKLTEADCNRVEEEAAPTIFRNVILTDKSELDVVRGAIQKVREEMAWLEPPVSAVSSVPLGRRSVFHMQHA